VRALVASLTLIACAAVAEPTMERGVVSVRLLDSECPSDTAKAVLEFLEAKTPAKRADVMLAGQFVPACWAEDEDRDILLAGRDGSVTAMYRNAFTEIGKGPQEARGTGI
jgi:hypothetical protein